MGEFPPDSEEQSRLDWWPLTLAQLDFWEEYLAHPGVAVSTVAHSTRFQGDLDQAALVCAIRQVAAETDVMSLRFRQTPDGPMQAVDPGQRPVLQQVDLRDHPDPEAEATRRMQADIQSPLDLTRDLLAALWLLRLPDAWIWYCRGHHIFLDGYAMALIERRVAALYAEMTGGPATHAPFAPFTDYLREEDAYRTGPLHEKARAFWAERLAAAPPLRVLDKGSEDYPASPLTAEIDLSDLVQPLRACATALQLGEADLLTLLSAIWLWHHPGTQDQPACRDQVIWLPYMSRFGSVSVSIPAMVVNIFPFTLRYDPARDLAQNLRDLSGDLRRHRRHGRYRIEQMGQDQGLSKRQRYLFSPLINVMPFETASYPKLRCERDVLAAGPADGFNMTFAHSARDAVLMLYLEADPTLTPPDLFHRHVGGLTAYLQDCLTKECASPLPWGKAGRCTGR
ncbi:condensation domain-containing protein [Paracoccus homiensis]|uniref:Enterobactin synthetase component F n=1 Tax=Paracoccus homiensis TaxID=364199 RepID=A0A1H9Z5U7_9RHOB|nr:condensation domain-containing protein [Paracoccus homiensis]SES76424.1 enterobactin synthetase component F [Paracoccus homiensis]